MKRTITRPISYTLPPVEAYATNPETGATYLDEGRCRGELDVSTFVTTQESQSQFRDAKGKLHLAKMTTVRLYGVQGVASQPVPKPKRVVEQVVEAGV